MKTAGKAIDYRYLENRLSDLEARVLELEKHLLEQCENIESVASGYPKAKSLKVKT